MNSWASLAACCRWAGIIAAIIPLNDHAVVPTMLSLHRHLQADQTLAKAMRSLRGGFTPGPI